MQALAHPAFSYSRDFRGGNSAFVSLSDKSRGDSAYAPTNTQGSNRKGCTEYGLQCYPEENHRTGNRSLSPGTMVWQSSHSKEQILAGEDTKILLNHAGGYREAVIHVQNLRVIGLTYVQAEDADRPASPPAEPENPPVEPEKLPVEPEKPCEEPEDPSEPPAPNYGLLAFEWVENHAVELNERCNEYIAQKQDFLLLTPSELPERDSWLDICQELSRNGMENCECTEEGIQINLTQGSCRKE